jgi:GAF domain-containing protein
VIQTIGQLLLQFVGAGSYVIYSVEGENLIPVASEGLAPDSVRVERVGEGPVGGSFLANDVIKLSDDPGDGVPLAAVPLRVGDEPIGAVAVFDLLEQKNELADADFELLRMLATQGATALAGARLYAAAHGAIPRLSLHGEYSSSGARNNGAVERS